LYPGAPGFIERLRAGQVPIAVATAAQAERLARSVPDDFLANFDVIVTGNDTQFGKPSPEPYLAAAKKLRVQPEQCIVIENAPLGIESAKAAGAYCIALCTTLDRSFLEGADEILNSLEEVQESEMVKPLLTRAAANA
ncbi:MAG: HAD family phosphatase, partial [Acidobacteriota bacterium]